MSDKLQYNKSTKLFGILQTTFNNYDETVHKYLTKMLGEIGQNYNSASIYNIIFTGIKGIFQNVMFYIEDALTEQNIFTASRKKSIYSLARQTGYQAFYGSAACGILNTKTKITNLSGNVSSKIYIPDECKLKNTYNGLIYTIMLPTSEYTIDLSKPLKIHQFKIVQGTYKTNQFISKGILLETMPVNFNGNYDKEYTKVFVNGKEWNQFVSLYDMNETDEGYVIYTGYDSSFEITFGNGTNGKLLKEGDIVKIKYLTHSGEIGNLNTNLPATFTFESNITNSKGEYINGNEYLKFYLNSAITGGTNSDSIEFIKKTIGSNSRSNVLATENNFKQFLKQFSFIGQTTMFSHKGSLKYIACCLNNKQNILSSPADYLNLSVKDLLLTEQEKEIIISSLESSNKIFTGATFSFIDPIVARYSMICYIKANNNYNKESIEDNIYKILGEYFMSLEENTEFIAKSDIVKLVIDNVPNIIAFDFDFISELNENAYKDNYYSEYILTEKNNDWQFDITKKVYQKTEPRGLDMLGNISLPSKLYIPLLSGGFKYWVNKEEYNKTDCIITKPIEIYFIN